MNNFEATCKSSANRQIIILLVHLSDYEKKADFVIIPCFAVKYYYSFRVEGSKKHGLIFEICYQATCTFQVCLKLWDQTSVAKTFPGHILNTYEDKV